MAAQATGVRWTPEQGEAVVFEHGRSITVDGYGDYEIRDDVGAVIATRKRARTESIEAVYGG